MNASAPFAPATLIPSEPSDFGGNALRTSQCDDHLAQSYPLTMEQDEINNNYSGKSSYPATNNKTIQSDSLTENQIGQLLQQGFTRGLAESLNEMKKLFALRYWIIDNSGSMQQPDGHRLVANNTDRRLKIVPCTRWTEIVDCVEYHIRLAGLIEAPTRFRLLNNPGAHVGSQYFSVAENPNKIELDVTEACRIIHKARPEGVTPLTALIKEIYFEVSNMEPELRRLGQKVVVVIATDGLPTNEQGIGGQRHNQDFIDALRRLGGLPVWVVIRLCTDDETVVDFYNDLDNQLEMSLEVLDDFVGEALEVNGVNPWLTYALPLHRLREFGFHHRVFDMLDERSLTKMEIRDFCILLFGKSKFDGVADPFIDWDAFSYEMERLLKQEPKQYDPVTKRISSWINMNRLNRIHGSSNCGCSIM